MVIPRNWKKSKLKRKKDDQIASAVSVIDEGNKQILEQLKISSAQRQQFLDNQIKNYALKQVKEDNKMLFHDVNTIVDPNVRAFVLAEQAQILAKRAEQHNQQTPLKSSSYGQYFNYLGGYGSCLPNY